MADVADGRMAAHSGSAISYGLTTMSLAITIKIYCCESAHILLSIRWIAVAGLAVIVSSLRAYLICLQFAGFSAHISYVCMYTKKKEKKKR